MQFDFLESGANDVIASQTYAEFKKRLSESNCQKCPELCGDRHNIVVDRGNPETKIMAIGEGPGENEDLQGKAFVGRAGQLFDKIMDSVGINTNQDMLIANVVKCRPPNNRAPKPIEASNCFPFLKWQLNHIKPKVVLLLGATAAKHLMPNQKGMNMKDRVGQFFEIDEYPGVKFYLLYHPAYILRDPRKKPLMWNHVKALKKYCDENNLIKAQVGV